jgi:glutamyl-tRNA synthetase
MILGDDGQKLSKRHGAVSVMQYDEDGFLPEAVLNYLARLGWSHGDEEVFTMAQFVDWFDLDHITSSAAQFNTEKLLWLNQHFLKQTDDNRLAAETKRRLDAQGISTDGGPDLLKVVALYKDRAATLKELADAVHPLYAEVHASSELREQHLTDASRAALAILCERLADIAWEKTAIGPAIKETAIAAGLKMPQVAMPLRVLLLGQAQTPSIDAIIEVMGRDLVIDRLKRGLA